MRSKYHRQTAINRLRAHLEATGVPRLQMLLIVGLTGGSVFLASYLTLRCCVTSMAVRYPIAIPSGHFYRSDDLLFHKAAAFAPNTRFISGIGRGVRTGSYRL